MNTQTRRLAVEVEWDGYHWCAFPEGGGSTFADRIEDLPALVVEVVHLMTGRAVTPDELVLHVHPPSDARSVS